MTIDVARLKILTYPAAPLREVARPVEEIDQTVRDVAARMIELTHEAEGVGLAAPQIGLPWRLFVTVGADRGSERVYINPRLEELDGELTVREEGCLSLPGVNVDIRRPASATITALDLEGRAFTLREGELLGRVWQHECDHLDGVLIIDKMSPMDRIVTRKVLKELEAAAAPTAGK
ncbi:MAG: peptide deformylase [Planctomycetota bacterium]|jgi:peptide deformylase